MTFRIGTLLVVAATVTTSPAADAGDIGHFNGGVMNLRDYLAQLPQLAVRFSGFPGTYAARSALHFGDVREDAQPFWQ